MSLQVCGSDTPTVGDITMQPQVLKSGSGCMWINPVRWTDQTWSFCTQDNRQNDLTGTFFLTPGGVFFAQRRFAFVTRRRIEIWWVASPLLDSKTNSSNEKQIKTVFSYPCQESQTYEQATFLPTVTMSALEKASLSVLSLSHQKTCSKLVLFLGVR